MTDECISPLRQQRATSSIWAAMRTDTDATMTLIRNQRLPLTLILEDCARVTLMTTAMTSA